MTHTLVELAIHRTLFNSFWSFIGQWTSFAFRTPLFKGLNVMEVININSFILRGFRGHGRRHKKSPLLNTS